MSLLNNSVEQALVGDITPYQGITKAEKHKKEAEAMNQLKETLENSEVGQELVELWQEYEAQATPEAKLVKEFDKMDMLVQAYEYESKYGKTLTRFFTSCQGAFSSAPVVELNQALNAKREAMLAARPASFRIG